MDNLFSSPGLVDDLTKKKINHCGTVRLNRKGMPEDLRYKMVKLRWEGSIWVRTWGNLTAIQWMDKWDVCMLTKIHDPQEGNFCDEQGNAIKLETVADYDRHMGYVDKGDRMANSYSISCCTWEWKNKLFFHLFDLAILNSYIVLSSYSGKNISHRNFQFTLLRNVLEVAWKERWLQRPIGRPPTTSVNIRRLDTSFNKHCWAVVCALQEVWHGKTAWNVWRVMWPYVLIKCVSWIITQRRDCKIFHMQPPYTNL